MGLTLTDLAIVVAVVAVLGLVGVGGFFLGSTFTGNFVSSSQHLAGVHGGMACIEVYRADGTKENLGCNSNMYTNYGRNATRQIFFGAGGSAAFDVISVGVVNASEAVTDRCLANQTGAGAYCKDWNANGLQPAVGTAAQVTGSPNDFGNVSITKTFTCTNCVNTVINGTGLYNSTTLTDLTMFASANFTSVTLQTNDQINVTWFLWTT